MSTILSCPMRKKTIETVGRISKQKSPSKKKSLSSKGSLKDQYSLALQNELQDKISKENNQTRPCVQQEKKIILMSTRDQRDRNSQTKVVGR